MKLIRRDFFRSLAVGLGGLGLLGRRGRVFALSEARENRGALAEGCQFFNESQARTLEAVCDQLIPPDDEFPGAKEAGVLFFIDRALTQWLPQHRWDYVVGLEGIDETSRLTFDRPFRDLTWNQQTRILETLEQGRAPGRTWERLRIGGRDGNSARNFFDLVLRHTMQGFYADSAYGGNKDRISWKMIGYLGHGRH